MTHIIRIPTEFRFAKLIFRDDLKPDIMINVYDQHEREIDMEHVDLDLPPGLLTSLRAVIDARLNQLAEDEGIVRRETIPSPPPIGG